jgi:hypothetical protein
MLSKHRSKFFLGAGLLFFLAAGFLVWWQFFSVRSLADDTMGAIANGEFRWRSLGGKPTLISTGADVPKGIVVTRHLVVETGVSETSQASDAIEQRVYELPRGVVEYKHLRTEEMQSYYWNYRRIGRSVYREEKEQIGYQSYEEFVSLRKSVYEDNPGFRRNAKLSRLEYKSKVSEKRFIYRVQTTDRIVQLKLVFAKTGSEWRLIASFVEAI